MPGTRAGGQKAARTNKERHGNDYFYKIGSLGGKNSPTSGFYANRELASRAGKIGGQWGKRGKKRIDLPDGHIFVDKHIDK